MTGKLFVVIFSLRGKDTGVRLMYTTGDYVHVFSWFCNPVAASI